MVSVFSYKSPTGSVPIWYSAGAGTSPPIFPGPCSLLFIQTLSAPETLFLISDFSSELEIDELARVEPRSVDPEEHHRGDRSDHQTPAQHQRLFIDPAAQTDAIPLKP